MKDDKGHKPVLAQAVVEFLAPVAQRDMLDCTLGLGGHSKLLLEATDGSVRLIGLDLDEENVRLAKQNLDEFGGRIRCFWANFTQIHEVLSEVGIEKVDAVLADLGFASNQMDDPVRGLSFQSDGPLDMRLDRNSPRTADSIVNQVGEKDLADLIFSFGEERYSRRIARGIVWARKKERIQRTGQLAEIVARSLPRTVRSARRGVHPATRTFQALRIAVNDELKNLDTLLEILPGILAPHGRAAIISFHSLEDRRVKQAFARYSETGIANILTKKPITATELEIQSNPRSRSAKLRVLEKTA